MNRWNLMKKKWTRKTFEKDEAGRKIKSNECALKMENKSEVMMKKIMSLAMLCIVIMNVVGSEVPVVEQQEYVIDPTEMYKINFTKDQDSSDEVDSMSITKEQAMH